MNWVVVLSYQSTGPKVKRNRLLIVRLDQLFYNNYNKYLFYNSTELTFDLLSIPFFQPAQR